MTGLQVGLLILGALAALGLSVYAYRVREPAGRGRNVLIALRTLTLTLLVLLLIDPQLDAAARRGRGGVRLVVDASLSMSIGRGDSTAWRTARASLERLEPQGPVLLAGNGVRAVPADSLAHLEPYAGDSRLLPAIQSAAEGGARSVLVITDKAFDDAAEIARWLPALGVGLDFVQVGGAAIRNRALGSVEAPAWAEAGKPITIRVGVAATDTGSAELVVTQGGAPVARTGVALVGGGTAAAELSFAARGPARGGYVRYDIALARRDSIPDDDVRSIYVYVSEHPAGVAVVSFQPDWEPRFLHPVLENALGLPVRSFLRLPNGTYIRAGGGLEAGGRVDEAAVTRAVAEADLLVLHGLGSSAPEWATQAARAARRALIFPSQDGALAPMATGPATEGDWYVAADLPASPIGSLLAGIDAPALPPLTALHRGDPPAGAWAPLLGGRSPRGGTAPLVVAAEQDGRRWAVALGSGYWRWAFRGGAGRDAYERLWAALAGWIVQERAQVAGAAIRPVERAVPRATPLRWVAPGIAADSLVLTLLRGNRPAGRATLSLVGGDTAFASAPAPGHYDYEIIAYADGSEAARARGPLTVETYSREFMRRPVDTGALEKPPALLSGGPGRGRPLHSLAWLYVLLVALVCTEWILRRRWGLR